MSRVRRIRVEVEVEDDNGEITVHEAEGTPRRGDTRAQIIPRYRDQYSRSAGRLVASEVVDVEVRLDAVLTPGDAVLFRVAHPGHTVLPITEAPNLADHLTSHSIAPVLPIKDQSGEAS